MDSEAAFNDWLAKEFGGEKLSLEAKLRYRSAFEYGRKFERKLPKPVCVSCSGAEFHHDPAKCEFVGQSHWTDTGGASHAFPNYDQLCGYRVWPYTENNVCILYKGHERLTKEDKQYSWKHRDAKGRTF
jgi:hypothetical protein